MEMVYKLRIHTYIKDNFIKIKNMVKEKFNIRMGLSTKVSLFKIIKMVLENSLMLRQNNSILVNSKIIKEMVMVF
jgi:hypothetical protein